MQIHHRCADRLTVVEDMLSLSTSVAVACCGRLCVEELRGVPHVDVLIGGITNTPLRDDGHSLTPEVDEDAVGDKVSIKSTKDAEQTGRVSDNNSLSLHPLNSESALTDNSYPTSVNTDDLADVDCINAEKDTSAVTDEMQNGLNTANDEEPVVLALNLTKNNSPDSNGKVSPQSVGKKFVIIENDDSGDESMDAPMDLSRGPKSSQCHMVNGAEFETDGMVNGIDYHDDDALRGADMSFVRKCQEQLRNEETKLVLLKKIRHSQAVHRLVNDSVAKHSTSSSSSSSSVILSQSLSGPPPLVRGGFQSSVTASHRTSVHQSLADMPRLHMQATAAHSQNAHHSAHGPPPLIMAPHQSSIVTSASRSTTSMSLTTHSHTSVPNYRPTPSSQPPPAPEQTAAQRQAAAKLALRRQLEKTLLQIPPPKPPPPEMNFIPNINTNAEFIMLVGLEEAVKCIVDADAQTNVETASAALSDVKYVFTPFECVQCQTDFTPVWKRDRPGSKSVICERCVTTNQKRALKQEHTNRLKGAFVRALQQEQEIEQSLLAGVTSGCSTPPPVQSLITSSHLTSSSRTSASSTSLKPGTESSRHYQGITSYPSAPNLRSTSGTTVAVPGMSLPSAAAAAFTASRLMFPYQQGLVPSTASRSSSSMDLPRQFLLDMIPRRAPVDGQVLWRT